MDDPQPYPLTWPAGWPRRPADDRQQARFRVAGRLDDRLSMPEANRRLHRECRLLVASNVVISTNVPVRRDGLPRAGRRTPDDPGAAVYLRLEVAPGGLAFACDAWLRVEDNIAAVAAHIGALRAIDRWGVGSVNQVFAGYKRLTAGSEPASWWEVLGVEPDATPETVKRSYKKLAELHHPDRATGDEERFKAISGAWRDYRKTMAT